MFTVNELNIKDYIGYAESHVGETHDLRFQSLGKYGEVAGKYTILKFEASDNPHFGFHWWKNEENNTPDTAELGFYWIRFEGTKFYNGKTIKCAVSAYVQSKCDADGFVDWYRTKALHISTKNEETGKFLRAYEFGILDLWSRA